MNRSIFIFYLNNIISHKFKTIYLASLAKLDDTFSLIEETKLNTFSFSELKNDDVTFGRRGALLS